MGMSVSKIRDEATLLDDQGTKQRLEERLQIMERVVLSHLHVKQSHILAERDHQEIHSGIVLQEFKQVNVILTGKPSEKLSDAIDDFFSGHVTKGLGELTHLAVATVLGNPSMGEYETSKMLIVWTDNAFLRYDIHCYRWNFAYNIEDIDGVAGVLVLKRVIDLAKTNPQVLKRAISCQASVLENEGETEEMVDEAMKVLEKAISFQTRLRKSEAESGITVPSNEGMQ